MKGYLKFVGFILFLSPYMLNAQAGLLRGKKIGVYVSSRAFEMNEDFYLQAAQFLKLKEDRSYTGELDTELLIRIGEIFCKQLQSLAEADTVFFLNADVEKGYAFQEAFDSEQNKLTGKVTIKDTDMLVVMSRMKLSTRSHRSVFIRSNRMFTERVKVKKADVSMSLFDPALPELSLVAQLCFDEYNSPKRPAHFDFYGAESPFGKFMGRVFSQWWWQLEEGIPSSCEEE